MKKSKGVLGRAVVTSLALLLLVTGAIVQSQARKPSPATQERSRTVKPPAPLAPVGAPRLNLNTATATQLDALPGIGPKTAERILEYRQKIGGFKKIEQVMNVRGVGEKNFLRIKDRITAGPSGPATRKP